MDAAWSESDLSRSLQFPADAALVPKPRDLGSCTGGPPDSRQSIHRRWPPLSTTVQDTASAPFTVDNAPYLAALVANSCSTMASISAARGASLTDPPSSRTRSPAPSE